MENTVNEAEERNLPQDEESGAEQERDVFGPGDLCLFVGRQQREFMVRLTPGKKVKLKGEYFDAEKFIGLPVGVSIVTPFKAAYLTMRPTLSQVVMNMRREAQIIYPKDLGQLLYQLDLGPGSRVIEVGTGHGAMTMSLIRAVGAEGRVVSYEIRGDHARQTRNNVKRFIGETPWWQVKVRDVVEGGVDEENFEAVMVDMPSPWELVHHLVPALAPGGTAAFLLPTVPQVVKCVDALKETGKFAHVHVSELLQRPWAVEGLSVRPEMRMSGHTGFLITARRKLGEGGQVLGGIFILLCIPSKSFLITFTSG